MKRLTALLVFLASLVIPLTATAADLSYNNFSIAYALDSEVQLPPTLDGDGFKFEGNLELTPALYLTGNVIFIGYDLGVDLTSYQFGLGGHMPLGQFDLYGEVQLGNLELDVGGSTADDDSFSVTVGARGMVAGNLELGVEFESLGLDDDFNDQDYIRITGTYFLDSSRGVFVQLADADHFNHFYIGYRMNL